jgi:REP element-mobilizing transposase RayT
MRNFVYSNGGFYHVYNRGVDKRDIFVDDDDKRRFIESMYRATVDSINGGTLVNVSISCYCLMDNHFHILLQQKNDQGVGKLMHRLGVSYTKYFNKKYGRSGRLFESVYRAKTVMTDAHLLHLSRYIFTNPVDIVRPRWKESGLKDIDSVMNYLMSYEWSNLDTFYDDDNHANGGGLITSMVRSKTEYMRFIEDYLLTGSGPKLSF